jgi:hypothetical protein
VTARTGRRHVALRDGTVTADSRERLFISGGTVDTHRAHIMRNLQLGTRAELVLFALANDLIGPPPNAPANRVRVFAQAIRKASDSGRASARDISARALERRVSNPERRTHVSTDERRLGPPWMAVVRGHRHVFGRRDGSDLVGGHTFGRVVGDIWAGLVIVESFLIVGYSPLFGFSTLLLATLAIYALTTTSQWVEPALTERTER